MRPWRGNGSQVPGRQLNDLSRSLAPFDQDTTLIAVIEIDQSGWLVAGIDPGPTPSLEELAVDEGSLCGSCNGGEMGHSNRPQDRTHGVALSWP